MIIYQKDLFKLIPTFVCKFQKFEKFQTKKIVPKYAFLFVFLLLTILKATMTKSETRLSFKPLSNH